MLKEYDSFSGRLPQGRAWPGLWKRLWKLRVTHIAVAVSNSQRRNWAIFAPFIELCKQTAYLWTERESPNLSFV